MRKLIYQLDDYQEDQDRFKEESKNKSIVAKLERGREPTSDDWLEYFKFVIDKKNELDAKLLKNSEKRVYLSTAHFSKFLSTVSDSLKIRLTYPQKMKVILKKKEH